MVKLINLQKSKIFFLLTILIFNLFVFSYSFSQEGLTITLKKGWNLISLPAEDIKIKNTNCDIRSIWAYENGKWNKLSSLENLRVGKGYWVYVRNDCEINFEGSFVIGTTLENITKGWNLVGVNSEIFVSRLKEICPTVRTVWSYENGKWIKLKDDDKLVPNKGYWVYSNGYCDVRKSSLEKITREVSPKLSQVVMQDLQNTNKIASIPAILLLVPDVVDQLNTEVSVVLISRMIFKIPYDAFPLTLKVKNYRGFDICERNIRSFDELFRIFGLDIINVCSFIVKDQSYEGAYELFVFDRSNNLIFNVKSISELKIGKETTYPTEECKISYFVVNSTTIDCKSDKHPIIIKFNASKECVGKEVRIQIIPEARLIGPLSKGVIIRSFNKSFEVCKFKIEKVGENTVRCEINVSALKEHLKGEIDEKMLGEAYVLVRADYEGLGNYRYIGRVGILPECFKTSNCEVSIKGKVVNADVRNCGDLTKLDFYVDMSVRYKQGERDSCPNKYEIYILDSGEVWNNVGKGEIDLGDLQPTPPLEENGYESLFGSLTIPAKTIVTYNGQKKEFMIVVVGVFENERGMPKKVILANTTLTYFAECLKCRVKEAKLSLDPSEITTCPFKVKAKIEAEVENCWKDSVIVARVYKLDKFMHSIDDKLEVCKATKTLSDLESNPPSLPEDKTPPSVSGKVTLSCEFYVKTEADSGYYFAITGNGVSNLAFLNVTCENIRRRPIVPEPLSTVLNIR
ncbi:MAG: hypothetical protein QW197_00430 [Candidatus Aenigmatarchaeota archaeon]